MQTHSGYVVGGKFLDWFLLLQLTHINKLCQLEDNLTQLTAALDTKWVQRNKLGQETSPANRMLQAGVHTQIKYKASWLVPGGKKDRLAKWIMVENSLNWLVLDPHLLLQLTHIKCIGRNSKPFLRLYSLCTRELVLLSPANAKKPRNLGLDKCDWRRCSKLE